MRFIIQGPAHQGLIKDCTGHTQQGFMKDMMQGHAHCSAGGSHKGYNARTCSCSAVSHELQDIIQGRAWACWYPVWSNRMQNFPIVAETPNIGIQDINHVSEDSHTGYQECGNEHTITERCIQDAKLVSCA
jgi:hypothetical protein